MFDIGDKVVFKYQTDMVGTIRSKYRHHYLVSWDRRRRWGRIGHYPEQALLLTNSPLFPELREIEHKIRELDKQTTILDNSIDEITKQHK